MSLSTEKATDLEAKTISGFQEDLEYLRQAPMLRGLDYECLKLLAMICRRIEYTNGDQLMTQGEDDGHAFFIISGRLDAIYAEGELSHIIGQYGAGHFVGGCALLGRMPRIFILVATEKTTTLRLSRGEFQKVLQQFPNSISKITAGLVSELVEWDRSVLDFRNTEKDSDFRALGVSLL